MRPAEENFCETPTSSTMDESAADKQECLPAPLQGIDADTPVMMYCTGGIRCDIYSTYLKKQASMMIGDVTNGRFGARS